METYFDNMTAADGSKEKLARDIRILVSDGKDLLSTAGSKAGAEVKAGSRVLDTSVRKNPYTSIAIALGVGAALGWLLGGSRRD